MKQLQIVRKQSRYSKGVVIAASRKIFNVKGEEAWLVESETKDNKYYKVTEDGECQCPDFQNRRQICKHMYAIFRRTIAK